MQASGIPAKFPIPFAKNAGVGFIRTIPQASQIGITAGAASLNDGFPPQCFSPVGSGGTPPFGVDFNGLLNQSTAWNQWQQAGGTVQYDATFSTAIGGYPAGAVLASTTNTGLLWYSFVDNNTTNPDGGSPSGWTALNPVLPVRPRGRLTMTTGVPILTADVIGATTIFYTDFDGNQVPIWGGTQWFNEPFTGDLTLTLTSALTANSICDVFGAVSAGALVIGFGPLWTIGGGSVTPGSCARGTGAGSTQLQRKAGIYTNANIITLTNGVTSYASIPANQATYLGSLFIDGTAGQVSCHVSYGQSRKFGVWNAYNRQPIFLKAGDPTASWPYASNVIRPSNGSTANSIQSFTGLPEEFLFTEFEQLTSISAGPTNGIVGIGFNSTTAFSSYAPQVLGGSTVNIGRGKYTAPPSLGLNTITSLERVSLGTQLLNGTESNMMLTAAYRG